MNELSLFSGAGGGLLATQHLLGWKLLACVEINTWCCERLNQRMQEGYLEQTDIYNMDIRDFNRRVAKIYRGKVDVITGGDPCQANSAAWTHGKRKKSLALEFIETIRIIRPTYAIRENPAKLRQDAPSPDWKFKEWLEDLGYTVTIAQIKACCVGAEHRRARMFVLGQLSDTLREGLEWNEFRKGPEKESRLRKISGQNRGTTTPRILRKSDDVAHRVEFFRAFAGGEI